MNYFGRWRAASGVKTLDKLCDLIVLKQLKLAVPSRMAVYITEQPVHTVGEAAVLADQYVLAHRNDWTNLQSPPTT